jgi:thiamine pyrophosphokinase
MNILIIADAPNKIIMPDNNFDSVIALDGAADKLLSSGITPTYIIGDLDTITTDTISIFESQKKLIIRDYDQNTTDLDKGIILADSLGATSIIIINSQGGRTDHTLYALKALKKHYKKGRSIVLINDDECIEFLKDCHVTYQADIGAQFAIFGMPRAHVSSHGLRYELDNYAMEFGISESSSNMFANETVILEISGEAIVIAPKGQI